MSIAEASTASIRQKPILSAERKKSILTIMPALPLIAFLVVFFIIPLSAIFYYSVQDDVIRKSLSQTMTVLNGWEDGTPVPSAAYHAVISDLLKLDETGGIGGLSQRIGIEFEGGRAVVIGTVRKLKRSEGEDWQSRLESAHPAWKSPAIWRVIANASGTTSLLYMKWSMDSLEKVDAYGKATLEQGYDFSAMFLRTAYISLGVTLLTVLLGYPLAYVLSVSKGKIGALLLLLVLVPFWTSLLVRSMSWVVLLQSNGVVNLIIQTIGLSDEPLQLLYTRFSTVLAMTQIQLPFTVLPMYSVMKTIPSSHIRAARSLGAGPIKAHLTVYFPQAKPGIAAGALLTFILCLGYYITPALVGGAGDQMASYYIARFVNEELNWGLAAALSVILTVAAVLIALPLCRQIMHRNGGRL